MARVGIRDVAARAGVSVGTVSRVINDHPSVTPEVRAAVKAIVAELDYRPDTFAQSMRRRTSRTVGVVVPDLANPFFAEILQSAERAARTAGHDVLFVSSLEDPDAEADHLRTLAGRKVDGIVLVPSDGAHRIDPPKGVRLVLVDRMLPGFPGVSADHRGGARTAVEHLIGLGHRRIGCIAGPAGAGPARERLEGYLDVMAPRMPAGPEAEGLVVYGPFDYSGGRRAAAYLLDRPAAERPTAIFAGSDQQAIGALRAAADLGLAVPRDLSVVGFDGVPLSDLVNPRLTTVVQPVARLAGAAVEMILGTRPLPPPGQPLLFGCDLAERESTAPPPVAG
ncbi:LacI family DNA-binding transcriptional regulator [Oharaeibacter diazotrophicus]|uniref:LacI family transcriptional regulator n=1 Tax=Oharaeibacter diazotrophicus TaxID=1920512 RepID=A0A4R6RDV0_9HYPH|nr:LacI family DNA-binding transcriptional regulator [Oharaeibacter diazotrophicus]TDP84332.1 LacI family transcriptional regulator [Oharaeibacter diazotrophicus]BBE73369.1 catabolite control protein A [Pleomorphomonas sp. SM30]GLS75161.1 LacI family transcriptional regulator [Oharaeibacter diazotrophicus]